MPGSKPSTADYMISANAPINAGEVIASSGVSLTATFSPSGWICLDPTPNVVKRTRPTTPANTILTAGIRFPTGTTLASLQAASSTNGGSTLGQAGTLSH